VFSDTKCAVGNSEYVVEIYLKRSKNAPRPRWGSLQRYPNPIGGFEGPTSKGREEKGRAERGTGKPLYSGGEAGGRRRRARGERKR